MPIPPRGYTRSVAKLPCAQHQSVANSPTRPKQKRASVPFIRICVIPKRPRSPKYQRFNLPHRKKHRKPRSLHPHGGTRAHRESEYFAEGLAFMSPAMIHQVAQEALAIGWPTELEATEHITVNYGGPMLGNAAIVEQHWPLRAPPH